MNWLRRVLAVERELLVMYAVIVAIVVYTAQMVLTAGSPDVLGVVAATALIWFLGYFALNSIRGWR